MDKLVELKSVSKKFSAKSGAFSLEKRFVKAVDNVSLTIYPGETFGLVGESGCGKTTLGKVVLRLIESTEGEVIFEGQDIRKLSSKEMRKLRRKMQIIYQDPYSSMNPRMRIGDIIGEPLKVQKMAPADEIKKKVYELLDVVGLNESYYSRFPHECSGGQRQRVSIARALILNPDLIVCDEAVASLDVSTQSQIINLLMDIQEKFGLTYIFISHGLAVVKLICDRIGVMYLGKIVELTTSDELYDNPMHPYTEALFSAIPVPDPDSRRERIVLEGDVPSPLNPPSGCTFHTRCSHASDICRCQEPELKEVRDGHFVACHLYDGERK